MEKFRVITFIILLIYNSFQAQNDKTFIPTKGEIVFKEITKITDKKLFDESIKISKEKYKTSMKNSLLKEEQNKGKEKQVEEMVNTSASMMDLFYIEDSTQIHQYNLEEINSPSFSNNIILKIFEDKKRKEMINGYSCFKVYYEFQENKDNADEDYIEYAGDVVFAREMWVTEEIKLLQHPLIYEKTILEKYYPLKIIETQSNINGFKRTFKLDKISLQ